MPVISQQVRKATFTAAMCSDANILGNEQIPPNTSHQEPIFTVFSVSLPLGSQQAYWNKCQEKHQTKAPTVNLSSSSRTQHRKRQQFELQGGTFSYQETQILTPGLQTAKRIKFRLRNFTEHPTEPNLEQEHARKRKQEASSGGVWSLQWGCP